MKASQILLGLVAVLLLVVVLGGGCIFSGYNRVVAINEQASESWAQIDAELQRRADLIPGLVETVKGVSEQEQTVFLGIADARKAYFQAGNEAEKNEAGEQMYSALSRLLVLNEKYPELKSNESFLKLQDTLEGTENRVKEARRQYNISVKELDTYVRQFPGRIYASIAGISARPYLETAVKDREAPKVDFSDLKKKS